ncbi:MAG: hypothetical protein KatS3mg032_0859 [Cyclobacteriaceae bacterium]|nr:MAG: hypothetical protein KatS3mg032_0859 [Cyclobacteriaceae bacterium]
MKTTIGIAVSWLICSLKIFAQSPEECSDWIDKFCLFTNNGKVGLYDEKKKKTVLPAEYDSIITDEMQLRYILAWKDGIPYPFTMQLKPVNLRERYSFIRIVSTDDSEGAYLVAKDNRGEFIPITEESWLPSAVRVNDRLMISETEVTLRDWLLFMSDVQKDVPFSKTMPDSSRMHAHSKAFLRWFLKYMEEEVSHNTYLKLKFKEYSDRKLIRYPSQLLDKSIAGYGFMPVTGISYEQAQLYCKWLTDLYEESYTGYLSSIKVNFRLPAKEEWEKLTLAGLNASMRSNQLFDSLNTEGCFLFNYRFASDCKSFDSFMKKYGSRGVMQVMEFFPDNMGVYNLFGNVAEMTEEKGLAKGGHYDLWARLCAIDKDQHYEQPEPWLGFRWVAEVLLKKK